jgi:hypothetical protein
MNYPEKKTCRVESIFKLLINLLDNIAKNTDSISRMNERINITVTLYKYLQFEFKIKAQNLVNVSNLYVTIYVNIFSHFY